MSECSTALVSKQAGQASVIHISAASWAADAQPDGRD